MMMFLTILAWIFLILSSIRIIGVFVGIKENAQLIRIAEAMGGNPVFDAIKFPAITFIICISWIISTLMS